MMRKYKLLAIIIPALFSQTLYGASSPTVTVDSISRTSGVITISYTAADADGDKVAAYGWQYSQI